MRRLAPAVETALRSIDLVRVADTFAAVAGMLEPPSLRSLDAVHLAAAQLVAPELRAIVTYDRRVRPAPSAS